MEGRPLVDLDTAERLGEIEQLIVDPDARRVAGIVVKRGGSLLPSGAELVLPAAAVHAVGPDAVTISHSRATESPIAELADLPRIGDLRGRKVVTHGGTFAGTVDDVLVDEASGQLLGYSLAKPGPTSGLEALFGGRPEPHGYVRADADLRLGESLMVVPDDAVSEASAEEPTRADGGTTRREVVWSSLTGAATQPTDGTTDAEATAAMGDVSPRQPQ